MTAEPNGPWVTQLIRNATDAEDGFLRSTRLLLHDRDPLFSHDARRTLRAGGVIPVRLPARSPNLNAYAKPAYAPSRSPALNRWCSSARARSVAPSARSSHTTTTNGIYQGMDNRLRQPLSLVPPPLGLIQCRHRLGRTLNYYYRAAA